MIAYQRTFVFILIGAYKNILAFHKQQLNPPLSFQQEFVINVNEGNDAVGVRHGISQSFFARKPFKKGINRQRMHWWNINEIRSSVLENECTIPIVDSTTLIEFGTGSRLVKPAEVAFRDFHKLKQYNDGFRALAGIFAALSLLFSIAMIDEKITVSSMSDIYNNIEVAYQNTYDAIAPLGLSDIVAIIVGESTAAAVAAFASSLILLSFKLQQILPSTKVQSDVVADGDFLVTKAAAISVLGLVGIPMQLANVISSLFATLPYGVIKLDAIRQEQIQQEDRLLDELLFEQQRNEEIKRVQNGLLGELIESYTTLHSSTAVNSSGITSNNNYDSVFGTKTLIPVEQSNKPVLDFVEIFSDIAKWLQYDVLCTKFGGVLLNSWPMEGSEPIPGFTASIFGAISCASAQFYCDILHGVFNCGGTIYREKVTSRTVNEWISLYISQTLYGSALFVSYEAFQIPAAWLVNALVSGGVDKCIGAVDYSGCVEVFIELNPPEVTPEQELYSKISPFVDSIKDILYR